MLSKENLEWQERARTLAEEVVRPVAWKHDRLQQYPMEVTRALADAGMLRVWIPEEYGGAGGDRVLNLCLVVEQISRCCGGLGVGFAVNALGSFPILVGGTEEQKQEWLPKIAAGEKLISFGLSEKNAGSDAQGQETAAVKDGDDWILNGEKKWNTGGSIADYTIVFAVTDPESRSRRISAFMIEKDMPGVEITKLEDKMGIRAIPVAELKLTDVKVPAGHLLGGRAGAGFKHAMMTLDRARPGVAAQAVGLAQGALEFAILYATERVQFGAPISSKQMVQQLLADSATKVEAARQLVYAAARAIDAGQPEGNKLAAMCKVFATDVAMQVTTDAVQVFGGYGYMKDYPVEKYMRDAKITQIYEGTNQVQRLVIARNLIKEASKYASLKDYIPIPEELR
ncbi:MAG: acyl-CoA dehydrogenase family protein [Planctomycetota bacterium]|jgi:alkylation response protein AidB-like acyl-CoA dehydrogenase